MFIFACIIYKAGPKKDVVQHLQVLQLTWRAWHFLILDLGTSLSTVGSLGMEPMVEASTMASLLRLSLDIYVILDFQQGVGIHLYQPTNQWLRSELDGYPTLAKNTGDHTMFLYEKGGNRSFLAEEAK